MGLMLLLAACNNNGHGPVIIPPDSQGQVDVRDTSTQPPNTTPPVTGPVTTTPEPVTTPKPTQPPVTTPPVTTPPVTTAPVSEPDETDPPIPDAPVIKGEKVNSNLSLRYTYIAKADLLLAGPGAVGSAQYPWEARTIEAGLGQFKTDSFSYYSLIGEDAADWRIDSRVFSPLSTLAQNFNKDSGYRIQVLAAYRTAAQQSDANIPNATWSDYESGFTMHLGFSYKDKKSGREVSTQFNPIGTLEEYVRANAWMDRFASYYGFVRRYPLNCDKAYLAERSWYGLPDMEKYAFRYVGQGIAIAIQCMNDAAEAAGNHRNKTLEDFWTEVKQYTGNTHWQITYEGKTRMVFEIWYVPANGSGDTEIKVPISDTVVNNGDANCMVYGNNADGYVVVYRK